MSISIITDFRTLLQLARELSDAEKEGDVDKINKARVKHDEYKDLCLKADRMNTGLFVVDL